ncbi:type VI secretion system tube protein TssD [Saccharicrinis aurantiacus]|uniref:type VI secretion system tube protein TssD n=1 Tax=Saccharicrinis aurantiacus TaxID=1849719 RepID=UPI000838E3BE|nr:type VI secretion system tube protein TssD [Saccharicrinis aurantiacus]
MFGHKSFLRIGELTDGSISGLYTGGYELVSCRYSFGQGIDQKGQAQTEVRGGSIEINYGNVPPNELLEWMLKSNDLRNGAIVICDANDTPIEKIYFEDAACVDLKIKHIKKTHGYTACEFVLQARKIIFESTAHENRWANLKN